MIPVHPVFSCSLLIASATNFIIVIIIIIIIIIYIILYLANNIKTWSSWSSGNFPWLSMILAVHWHNHHLSNLIPSFPWFLKMKNRYYISSSAFRTYQGDCESPPSQFANLLNHGMISRGQSNLAFLGQTPLCHVCALPWAM